MRFQQYILRVAAVLVLTAGSLACAQAPRDFMGENEVRNNERPQILQKVGIDQKLNQQVPLDLQFKDESGRDVRLGDYFGSKPVILTLVYYECPMLCTQVLNGLTASLDVLKFDVGKEFNVVTVSIDPTETPAMAAEKKKTYLGRYRREGAAQGWHFLTGRQEEITKLADAVGFRYAYDERIKQFAHASAIMILTPDGRMAQYHYGIEYSPKDIRLGLVEASHNKIGTPVDAVLLYCYHYDPAQGRYGAVAMNILRLGGLATMLVLGTFMVVMFRRDYGASRRARTGRA